MWLASVDARGTRVRLYALCEGATMGADAVFVAALGFLWSGTLRLGRAMVAVAPHNSVNAPCLPTFADRTCLAFEPLWRML